MVSMLGKNKASISKHINYYNMRRAFSEKTDSMDTGKILVTWRFPVDPPGNFVAHTYEGRYWKVNFDAFAHGRIDDQVWKHVY